MALWIKATGCYAGILSPSCSCSHLIQPSVNVSRKAADNGLSTWDPVTHVGNRTELLVPGFSLAHIWLLGPFAGVKQAMEDLSFCLSNT